MWEIVNSETEIVVRSGYIYAPLSYDAQIEAEVKDLTEETAGPAAGGREDWDGTVLWVAGKVFVKTLRLNSLVDNYQAAFPEEYEQQRDHLRQSFFPEAAVYQPLVNDRLKTILFEILPHFRRRRRSRQRQKNGTAAVWGHLAATLPEGRDTKKHVSTVLARREVLQQAIGRLESRSRVGADPAPEGRGPGRLLQDWLNKNVQVRLIRQELQHWQGELEQVQDLLNLPEAELAGLLEIAAGGAVEVDGCGCLPDLQHPGEYWVYLRTGAFALQDYFGRLYLFPDCRVAVATAGPWQPLVLETYKHPLLRRFEPRQQICLNDYHPDLEFSAGAIRRALEEGINALFYGYNSRKRNGYNSLDRFGRHQSVVDFEDWRIEQNDPRLGQGEVEVKNRYF